MAASVFNQGFNIACYITVTWGPQLPSECFIFSCEIPCVGIASWSIVLYSVSSTTSWMIHFMPLRHLHNKLRSFIAKLGLFTWHLFCWHWKGSCWVRVIFLRKAVSMSFFSFFFFNTDGHFLPSSMVSMFEQMCDVRYDCFRCYVMHISSLVV